MRSPEVKDISPLQLRVAFVVSCIFVAAVFAQTYFGEERKQKLLREAEPGSSIRVTQIHRLAAQCGRYTVRAPGVPDQRRAFVISGASHRLLSASWDDVSSQAKDFERFFDPCFGSRGGIEALLDYVVPLWL